jgi:hypothetical protein
MIEIVRVLNQVDMNIMEFMEKAIKPNKYNKIKNAITQAGLWDEQTKLTHYLGKREDESFVDYMQLDFNNHESLYIVVENDELR